MRLDPLLALVLFCLPNLVVFVALAFDKWRAKGQKPRVPETTLLMLGVPLAAAGMWLGMRVFRHKTSKTGFLIGAWIVTAVNVGLIWLVIQAISSGWLEFGAVRRPT